MHHIIEPFDENMKEISDKEAFSEVPNRPGEFYRGAKNEDGEPNGFGQKIFSDGSTYIGEFKNGKAESKGYYLFADGSYYNG